MNHVGFIRQCIALQLLTNIQGQVKDMARAEKTACQGSTIALLDSFAVPSAI